MNAAAAAMSGREAAFLAVRDALTGRGFVRDQLHALRKSGRLAGREAALAMQLALGAVRHTVTIARVLGAAGRFDERRTKASLRAVLYVAAYQMIWMDRVPLFAAVDEAVEQAHRHVRGRSPGMVNAVLRKLAQAIAERRVTWQPRNPAQVRVDWERACAFNVPVLPPPASAEDAAAHLAAAVGERVTRYRLLVERFGADRAAALAWASQAVPPTVLQRNTLRIGAADFRERIRQEFRDQAVCDDDDAFVTPSAHVVDAPLFREGLAYAQDPTPHAAAQMIGARAGERVLDLCAAPGGKSIALAQQMCDRGEVVASDTSAQRLELVRDNVARLGLQCIRPLIAPAGELAPDDLPGEFDAALIDVPCSNTGVIARRPEARLGLTARKLASLSKLQRDLLRQAALRVRPGGRLVYSTCSIEPEENEQVVDDFLTTNAKWRLAAQWLALPTWGPAWSDWRDGGFAARLVQTG